MCNYNILGMMQPQRRMNNNLSEMEEQKKQASKRRMMEAAAPAASKFPDDLKEAEFNLQQQTDADVHIIIRKALGDHNHFRKYLKNREYERLLLGLDSTVPGTPEVNDVDFDLKDILIKHGKNGTKNQLYKKVKQTEFAEPKGKVEHKGNTRPADVKPKPLPKPLDVPKQKEITKHSSTIDIGDILKKMTQTLPDTLTDIETPIKVPSSETFQFPQPTSQMPQVSKVVDEKLNLVNGETCPEKNSTIKVEPRDNAADSRNTFKKVGPDKKLPTGVKVGSGQKTKQDRKVSTSSTSSSDDSSSESSGSSDSESEKVSKVSRSTKKKPRSAINSPLVQQSSPSKMHKTEFGCSSYILNKENKLHPGLPYFPTDTTLKQVPINELNDFPYVQPHKNPGTDESTLIDHHPSLSPMDIETISPLDLFDGLDFTTYNGGDELLPSTIHSKTDDFDKVSNESLVKNRLKQTNTNDDFREPSLDDSLDDNSNNLILNKQRKGSGVLYQKDSKSNSKLYKSNETKHISKSKSTRLDSGTTTVPTKAARKYIPEQRRKSVSDNSDKEESKVRKSKDSSNKKSSVEKPVKKDKLPKRERLKPKVNVSKDTISIDKSDDNDSSDDKKVFLNITSPTLTQPTPTFTQLTSTFIQPTPTFTQTFTHPTPTFTQPTSATTTTTHTMPTLIKSTTCPVMQNQIPHLTDSVCTIPTDFNPPHNGYPVDDKCFFDDNHVTSNIYSMTTLSPMNSPDISLKYQEPPTLVKEIKEEEMRSSYDITASDIIAVELKSPVRKFVELPPATTNNELVNVGLNDNIIYSQENSLVNDIFTSQTHINDMSYSINDIFPSSLGLHELNEKRQPLLLPEINNESSLLDPLQELKPSTELQEELWVNDDPYSVNDIENIVPKIPPPQPVHHQLPCNNTDDDVLNSKSIFNVKCFEPITNFNNDINPPKLTIKIPLNGIKLKSNKYRSRTSNSICKDMDSSLSSTSDSFEIDVENDCSPLLKRKRKKHKKDGITCSSGVGTSNIINDVHKKTDYEFETPNKELIIRISLAKLKRAPLKGVSSSDQIAKGKGRPPKISRLNPEHPQDVTVTNEAVTNQDVVMKEKSPVLLHNFTPDLLPLSPPLLNSEEMKTEDCHKNDVSQNELLSNSDKETKKRRGRPPKEKINKSEVKHRQSKHETGDSKNCDTADVCHECGTLRKDYGRDSGRINSYKNTYIGYYTEARGCKHRADNLKTPIERAHKYTEAVLKYVQYLIGLELSGKMSVMQGIDEYMQITSECIQLVDYVVTHYGRKENPSNQSYDVRFTLLCLRLQSILYLKLFKVKKESAMKYSKVLSRYFKNFKAAGHTGPSLYPKPVHNRGSTGTPSPSSPSPGPSPGGSVASIGSAGSSSGSTGSNDITANGIGQYVTIPTDVHEKAFQHLQYSKNLLHGHILWEDSESLISHCQPFLIKLSRKAGHLTMQSSMLHVVDYVTAGLELIKESPHS